MRTLKFFALALVLMLNHAAHAQFVLPTLPSSLAGPGAPNPYMQWLPIPTMPTTLPLAGMPIPFLGTLQPAPTKPYTMRPGIPQETKRQMMQMMMPMMTNVMRMSMPDAMNWFAHKIKAKPGLSFDEVLESMNLRANQLNFKYVGSNLMWKDFRAVLGDMDSPRIEVHSYCDIAVGRDLLKISPEFLVFLPCRIAIMEDANKDIWVMMLDWNMDWVAGYEGSMAITPELAKGANDIRRKMEDIMRAAANGDL
jgi:uncharacterized protein (DUF302 family)